MLGPRQEGWLRRTLAAHADTTWQVIGQQVMLAPVRAPELGPLLDLERPSMLPREQLEHYVALSKGNPPMVFDTWNGYPHAREAFLGDLQEFARNPVVLSGDLHTSMANDVYRQDGDKPVTVEIMPPAVSSPGFDEYLPLREPGALSEATRAINPAVRYMDTRRRGWVHLTVTSDACAAEWRLVDTVHSRDYTSVGRGAFHGCGGRRRCRAARHRAGNEGAGQAFRRGGASRCARGAGHAPGPARVRAGRSPFPPRAGGAAGAAAGFRQCAGPRPLPDPVVASRRLRPAAIRPLRIRARRLHGAVGARGVDRPQRRVAAAGTPPRRVRAVEKQSAPQARGQAPTTSTPCWSRCTPTAR